MLGADYMMQRQRVFFLVAAYYLVTRYVDPGQYASYLLVIFFGTIVAALYPGAHRIGLFWGFYTVLLYTYQIYYTWRGHVEAACYAIAATHFGGWLYEIAFWHPSTMFYSTRYLWLVNTQILSGVFCVLSATRTRLVLNRVLVASLLYYLVTTVFWVTRFLHREYWPSSLWWLPRSGVMFLMWALIRETEK